MELFGFEQKVRVQLQNLPQISVFDTQKSAAKKRFLKETFEQDQKENSELLTEFNLKISDKLEHLLY